MEVPNWSVSKKEIIQPNLSDILANLSINNLSEQEKENYENKKVLINLEGFADMKILTEKELLVQEMTARGYSSEEINEIGKSLQWIKEERNTIINKLLMETVLLPQLEKTYRKFKKKWWSPETKKILEDCHKNAINRIHQYLKGETCENFKLRNGSKIARGETFLFTTNENKDKYIILEVKKITEQFKKDFKAWLEAQKKNEDIHIFEDQTFLVRRHIDDGTDITKMSDILLQWKKLLDYYLTDKHIKYITSCSWLFDDKFNEFWMKERAKEWKKDIPNRVKIREELKYYWWKLPDENIKESIENDIIPWIENSMTRAMKKYISEWNILKEGWGYIDLDELEKWESGK